MRSRFKCLCLIHGSTAPGTETSALYCSSSFDGKSFKKRKKKKKKTLSLKKLAKVFKRRIHWHNP